jgi:nucleoid-associated protein YgaU
MTSANTVHPPVLDPSSPGTPAGEWANNTTHALVPDANQPPTSQSTVTTPGNELPGAYPASPEANNATATAQGFGDTLVDTARPYLPQGVINTMENYLGVSLVQLSSKGF